jgi:hypothetical protein
MSENGMTITGVNGNGRHGPVRFVTSKGAELQLSGISPLLIAKLQSVGELPDIPTRKLRLELDGLEDTFQEEELSEEDLQTKEEEAAWKEYVQKRDEVLAKRNNGFMKAVFAKGVKVDLSHMDTWKEEQEFFGLEVPAHETDQKIEYIQTELIGNSEDLVGIITGVLGESGIPEEELASVRAMFQRAVRPGANREAVPAEGEVAVE